MPHSGRTSRSFEGERGEGWLTEVPPTIHFVAWRDDEGGDEDGVLRRALELGKTNDV